jgi:ribosomal protein S18 acetylase RimI-like enzyme
MLEGMSDAMSVVTDVQQNLRASFRALLANRGTGETREWPGLEIISLGVAFQMFNAAFLTAPVSDEKEMAQLLARAAVHFQARGQAWSFWVCESWVAPKARKRCWRLFDAAGMRLTAEMPGMAAELLAAPRRSRPELQYEAVRSERTRRAFCALGSVCFHLPPVWFEEVFDQRLAERAQFECWVGYLDGEAVATAATVASGASVTSGDCLGVYNLATAPAYRRRGFAEDALRFAVERGIEAHGSRRLVLQSSPGAVRLYERIGYGVVTRFRVYVS